LFLGERCQTEKIADYCANTNTHPSLWHSSSVFKARKITGDKSSESQSSNPRMSWENFTRPVWQLPNKTIYHEFDDWFSCIITPSGYSNDYNLVGLFSHTGNVKGMTKISAIASAMDYICFAIKEYCKNEKLYYPEAYLIFFSMLSRLFRDLLSPVFTADSNDLKLLYFRCVEIVSLHELMFPSSESLIVYHQLVDLVPFINNFGPLRDWWTLPMERSISHIKKRLPRGGISAAKTAVTRQFKKDLQVMKDQYSDKIPASSLVFSDQEFRICNGSSVKSIEFSSMEISSVLVCALEEIKKFCVDESGKLQVLTAVHQSSLFRLYMAFVANVSQSINRPEQKFIDFEIFSYKFYFWLCYITGDEEQFHELVQEGKFLKSLPNSFSSEELSAFCKEGKIFLSDVMVTREATNKLYDELFHSTEAYIFGSKFIARGSNAREIWNSTDPDCFMFKTSYAYDQDFQYPQNSCNKFEFPSNSSIKRQGYNHREYSSWCRFTPYRSQISRQTNNIYFAQFNFFFRLNMPHELILNGLPVASITAREAKKESSMKWNHNLCCITLNDDSYYPHARFIGLTNISASPIAIVYFGGVHITDNNPIPLEQLRCKRMHLKKLYFIEIDNHRCSLRYNKQCINNYNSTEHDTGLFSPEGNFI
jgi:hypothetical protein